MVRLIGITPRPCYYCYMFVSHMFYVDTLTAEQQ